MDVCMINNNDFIKWRTFIVSIFVTLCAGTLYGFGSYSADLAEILGSNVDLIGSCGDFGIYFGFTMGMLNDKYGPKVALSLATILVTTGYFCSYQMVAGNIEHNVYLLALFYFLIGQGSFGFFISSISVNSRNFSKENRGIIMGTFLCVFGMSSVVFTLFYDYVTHDNVEKLLKFLSLSVFLAGVIGILLIRKAPEILSVGLLDNDLLLSNDYDTDKEINNNDNNILRIDTPLNERNSSMTDNDDVDELFDGLDLSDNTNITGFDLLNDYRFWVYFALFFCLTGPSLMYKNSIGTIKTAFDYTSKKADSIVYVWSSLNSFFRIATGILADYFSKRMKKFSRIIFLTISSLISSLTYFLYLFYGEDMIWPITVATAWVYASAFAICSIQMSLYFGTENFGFNQGMLCLGPAVSGILFTSLAGTSEDNHNNNPDSDICTGEECFTSIFMLTSISYLFASILSLYLYKIDIGWQKKQGLYK